MPEAVIETVIYESVPLSMNFHCINSCKTACISAVRWDQGDRRVHRRVVDHALLDMPIPLFEIHDSD
jgi:hypothetical protein